MAAAVPFMYTPLPTLLETNWVTPQRSFEALPAGWAAPCDRKGPTTEAARTEGRNESGGPGAKRRVAGRCGGPRRERRPHRVAGTSSRPRRRAGARHQMRCRIRLQTAGAPLQVLARKAVIRFGHIRCYSHHSACNPRTQRTLLAGWPRENDHPTMAVRANTRRSRSGCARTARRRSCC